MQLRIKTSFALLLTVAAVSARPALAQTSTQTSTQSSTASQQPPRAELALGYSYLHSNAPPGGCGCFNMNGGSADFAWAIKPGSWDLVGDVVSGASGATSAAGNSIILSAFTAGVRYLPPRRPFLSSSVRPGAGRRGALQRNSGASAEHSGHQRRRGVCLQHRRRSRPERQPPLLHPPVRGRLPPDDIRQRK